MQMQFCDNTSALIHQAKNLCRVFLPNEEYNDFR